jgi:hypothetical protein
VRRCAVVFQVREYSIETTGQRGDITDVARILVDDLGFCGTVGTDEAALPQAVSRPDEFAYDGVGARPRLASSRAAGGRAMTSRKDSACDP